MKTSQSQSNNQLIIIGSGPVGMVAALMLKPYFKNIIIFERQSKEKFLNKYGFTFPIVLAPAAIKILEMINVWDDIMTERSEYFGIVIHVNALGQDLNLTITQDDAYSHWRNHIVTSLYERVVAEEIPIVFESNVTSIDFDNNICTEASQGQLSFDLLIGSDGINSFTRKQLAQAHPDYAEDEFALTLLDYWHAYRLPSTGRLKEKYDGGEKSHASNVYISNPPQSPNEKMRIVTTCMQQPEEEISILIKYDLDVPHERAKAVNEQFFSEYMDSVETVNEEWELGVTGKFEQVKAPTYYYKSVLLLGDSAHGFESTGDLINIGITSVEAFVNLFLQKPTLSQALQEYDQKIGENIRYYTKYAYRRNREKISAEVSMFMVAEQLGLVTKHPGMFGMFAEDFELQKGIETYKRDVKTINMLMIGVPILLLLIGFLRFIFRPRGD
ncbi:MAG: NAD(P)/FAD-dependent oxidoreductase [Chloroflexota bacterium]